MTFYLQGTTYGCHRDETHEIKQAKVFKRYTCQVDAKAMVMNVGEEERLKVKFYKQVGVELL
ncbi:hypothetical protein VL12_22280 [Rossellomorea marisflavi]|nr:hypothetical protein VL12_22280 [Rossellomorea marisflavi]